MTIAFALDPETERIAQTLAQAKGQPLAEVLREAILASAREAGIAVAVVRQLTSAEKRQRLLEISERSAARPILDARPADEILGYDKLGLVQ